MNLQSAGAVDSLLLREKEKMLMLHDIGNNAGKLWHYLKENPLSTMEDAGKSLKLQENSIALAAGWLAREDKLTFQKDGKNVRIALKLGE